jgi:hypothetical protein
MLAGMSTDYYTGLERGNLSGVSGSVLDALARPAARRGREDTPVRPRRHRQRRRPTGAQCAGQPRARPAAPLPSAESALVAIRSSSLRVRQIRRFWAAWSPPRTASLPAHSLLSSGRIEPISGSLVVAACERYGRFVKQHVRFCTATDGVRLAYAVHGSGPPLVRVAPWLSHLELDWESPVWRHWLQQLGKRHTLLRYDERGCGLSDTSIGDPSVDVGRRSRNGRRHDGPGAIRAAGRLSGSSDRRRVCGGTPGARLRPRPLREYARGRRFRGQGEEENAIVGAIRAGWKAPNPAFRRVFGALFLPNGTPEQMAWYEDLLWRTTTAAAATGLFRARGGLNVCELAPQVRARTLVMHARGDRVVPSKRQAARHADSGRAIRPAGVRQSHPARARAGMGGGPL